MLACKYGNSTLQRTNRAAAKDVANVCPDDCVQKTKENDHVVTYAGLLIILMSLFSICCFCICFTRGHLRHF